uniref:Uncharacterized protein n=1 Tax=Pfiesteria piscicida TaxID=71001 RepID=E8Z6M2_PFIPI|nr:unknown [Pfiesteria piscicida]
MHVRFTRTLPAASIRALSLYTMSLRSRIAMLASAMANSAGLVLVRSGARPDLRRRQARIRYCREDSVNDLTVNVCDHVSNKLSSFRCRTSFMTITVGVSTITCLVW